MGHDGTNWELDFRQCSFHHIMQVLRVFSFSTFSLSPAFPPCYCSLAFRHQVRRLTYRISSESYPGGQECVVSCHGAKRVLTALQTKYPDIKGPGDVIPPVGVANAYDAMHLMALAVEKAGSTEGEKIRQGLYAIDTHQGLIKTYSKPFSPDNHDALNEHDYIMVHYVGDQIEPIAK